MPPERGCWPSARSGRRDSRRGSSAPCWRGYRNGCGPHIFEMGQEVLEDAILVTPAKVEQRRQATGPSVEMWRHEHLVVEAEDRVVHGHGVHPKLDAYAL